MALLTMANALVYSTYLTRLPDLRDQAGIATSQVGAAMAIGNFSGLLAALVATPLVNRFGSRRMVLVAGPFHVATLPLLGCARDGWTLVGALVAMMSFNALVDVALIVQMAALGRRRGTSVMGRMAGLYGIGTMAGGTVASLLGVWRVAAPVHFSGLALLLMLIFPFVRRRLVDEPSTSAPEQTVGGPAFALVPVVLVGVMAALIVPMDVVPGEFTTFRLRDDLGLSASLTSTGYVVITTSVTLARFACDRLVHRWGARQVFAAGLLISVLGVSGLTLAGNPVIAFVGAALAGAGGGLLAPILSERAACIGTAHRGVGAMVICDRLAGFATPAVLGLLAGQTTTIGVAMAWVVLPCVAIALALTRTTFAPRPRG